MSNVLRDSYRWVGAALSFAWLLTGCATTSRETAEQAYDRFKRQEYVFEATGRPNLPIPLLNVRVQELTLDGQVLLIHPESPLASTIRNTITNLFTAIRANHVFAETNVELSIQSAKTSYRGTLTFSEKTHLHGGSLAKGAVVAGLTLGLFDNSAVAFDLESALELQLIRSDGNQRQYRQTNTVAGENRKRDNGAGWSAARLRANSINVCAVAKEMAEDKPFYAGQP